MPADAIGVAVVTLEDNNKAPEKLKAQLLDKVDFPVVVFFNATGFDASGTPYIVRKAADGKQLYGLVTDRPNQLRAVVPLRGGGWIGYYWVTSDNHGKISISDEEWASTYLGLKATEKLEPDVNAKEIIGKPSNPKEELRKEKNGVRGRVYKIGNTLALVPLVVPVHVYSGKTPFPSGKIPEFDGKAPRYVRSDMTDAQGNYSIGLDPGEYTVVIEYNGRLWGNAVKDVFPSIKVIEGSWIDYDFRRSD